MSFQAVMENPAARFSWVLKRIREHFTKGEKLRCLDVGCDIGILIGLLGLEGHDAEAIEPKDEARLKAQENNPGKIIRHQVDENERYDIISMNQVIEHVDNPKEMLTTYFSMLNPGGMLLFTTPIEHALNDLEHLSYFNFYDIADLCESCSSDYSIFLLNKFVLTWPELNIFAAEIKRG